MKLPISYAGLYLKWELSYAELYKRKLEEMGYMVKIIKRNEDHIVAYAYHRPFTLDEAIKYLESGIEFTDAIKDANKKIEGK